MDEQDLSYALAKQVPDMHGRSFIIGTSYGELTIPCGPLAERVANAVRLELALELARLRTEPVLTVELPKTAASPDYFDRTLMGIGQ